MRRAIPIALVLLLAATAAVGRAVIFDEPEEPGPASTRVAAVAGGGGSQLTSWGGRKQNLANSDSPRSTAATNWVPREVVIGFDPALSAKRRAAIYSRLGIKAKRKLPLPGLEVATITDRRGVQEVRRDAAEQPGVLFAEPNYIYTASATEPNDPQFDSLWGLSNTGQDVEGRSGTEDADIDAPESWDVTEGSRDITVAVVDSGVAYDHPDLAGNIWRNLNEASGSSGVDDDGNGYVDDVRGWDWVDSDAVPKDHHGHGTHVAGTIGAVGNDANGTTGVAWRTSIMPLRVLNPDGRGTNAGIASAFAYADRMGAHVVNASFGGLASSQTLLTAITNAPDTLFVVAAGNEGSDNDALPTYPCNYSADNVICVAASTPDDRIATFSNYGANNVDLAAPGERILSTIPTFRHVWGDDFGGDLSADWVTEPTWGTASDEYGDYLSDSPEGPYADNVNSSVRTAQPIDLTGFVDCRLAYVLRLETQPGQDGLVVEAADSGGSWTRLQGWTGSTGGAWFSASHSLSAYDGIAGLQIRFRMVSDATTTAAGADIDDVAIECSSATYTGDEYEFMSGTSMAAPHVTGAAALLWSSSPSASFRDVTSALLDGAQRIDAMSGRTRTGGRLDVYQALQVLDPELEEAAAEESSPESPPDSATTEDQGDSGGGGGGGGGGSDDAEEPEPQPTPSPSGSTTPPEPSPSESVEPRSADHPRVISLRLKRHLRARGRVSVSDAHQPCVEGIRVKIRRNGRVVARATTDLAGAYRTRLPDRRGRYVAVARRIESDGGEGACSAARSPRKRHRH